MDSHQVFCKMHQNKSVTLTFHYSKVIDNEKCGHFFQGMIISQLHSPKCHPPALWFGGEDPLS